MNDDQNEPGQPTTSIIQTPSPELVITTLQEQAQQLLQYAEARTILSVADTKAATDDLSIISKAKKVLEDKRKEYINPLNKQVKLINDTFKLVSDPLNQADKITRDKVLAFTSEQNRIRLQQEEINRKRMEAAEAEMKLKGELTEPVNLVEVTPEPPKRVSTDMGTTGQRDNWKYEIIDFAQLPDEYKVADSAMLNAVAKKHHDQKQIPGVRFYNEPIIIVRVR